MSTVLAVHYISTEVNILLYVNDIWITKQNKLEEGRAEDIHDVGVL